METSNAAFDPGATVRDLGRMDQTQLGSFVKKAATGVREDAFLPRQFFRYFNANAHGPSEDGRSAPGLANYLVETHEIVGLAERGVYTVQGGPADFGFRGRFRRVISELLDESTTAVDEPTDEQRVLASFAVEVVGEFLGQEEISNSYPPGTMTERLKQDLEELQVVKPIWTEKAQSLIDSGRFGQLQLTY